MFRPRAGGSTPHQEFIQIDTRNILFICGGAFDGIDKIIERRLDKRSLGFGARSRAKKSRMWASLWLRYSPRTC